MCRRALGRGGGAVMAAVVAPLAAFSVAAAQARTFARRGAPATAGVADAADRALMLVCIAARER
jgi:hypothetical protein